MATIAKRTNPKLWDEVKSEITAGDRGGNAGQWSARKAQLSVHEYKRRGGGYVGRKPAGNGLVAWTKEEWGTRSGEESLKSGERYLPRKTRQTLTSKDYERTTAKKRADTKSGKQFSSQPADVADKTARSRKQPKDIPSKKRRSK